MNALLQFVRAGLRLTTFVIFTSLPSFAAATLMQQIEPQEVNVGDQVVVTLTLQGGSVDDVHLPPADGLTIVGTRSAQNITFSGGRLSRSLSLNFALVPSKAGDLSIPPFDFKTQEGETVHVREMKIHVLGNSPIIPSVAPAQTPTAPTSPPNTFNPNGPVVMPPNNPAPTVTDPTATANSANPNIPRDPDGTPAKVFIIITPTTSDGYVGESIPLEINFYIRMDVMADQNSLPTIKGSDFLMNNFTTRGHARIGMLENNQYECETWLTAISAPKSGDFPLMMTRDTYWVKSISNNTFDPFGRIFGRRANLAHESIASNQLTMHIHPLPTEGQPDHFTGAIGQFQVTGDAKPTSVTVGEPLALNFTVTGTGNFDYVRCPVMPDDPAWKSYVASSKINYRNESHTSAIKTFEQSIIPNKNGVLPLPAASFSYFDPEQKKYVTIPITLPPISVTGSALPPPSGSSGSGNESAAAPLTLKPNDLAPNRLELGYLSTNLTPAYRHTWFWIVQAVLVALPILGAIYLIFRPGSASRDELGAISQRKLSRQQAEDAMTQAVQQNDAPAFFQAARRAVQLQLGTQWNTRPEALTLGEIRARDPQLAENLEELFAQADEVIYSGHASTNLNLAEWENRVRELLQLQTA